MSKCLVLFVEGDTEVEFYKQVIANARKLHPAGRFDTSIEYRNVRGVTMMMCLTISVNSLQSSMQRSWQKKDMMHHFQMLSSTAL